MRPRPGPVGEPSLGWPVPRVARTPSRLMSEMIGLRRNDSERAREHPRRANARVGRNGLELLRRAVRQLTAIDARFSNNGRVEALHGTILGTCWGPALACAASTALALLRCSVSSCSSRWWRRLMSSSWSSRCCAARSSSARVGSAPSSSARATKVDVTAAVTITPNATPWSITATTPRARLPRSWASRRHSRPSLRSAAPTLPDARVLVVIKRPDGHAADDHDQQRRGRDHACRVADRHRTYGKRPISIASAPISSLRRAPTPRVSSTPTAEPQRRRKAAASCAR
jgi:hypothetical protein